MECENYRGISLLCTSYKIFSKIFERRLTPYSEEIIGEYQGGFTAGRSTIDQLFTVKQVLEKCWEYNIDIHQIFVGFKQVYDSIDRGVLYEIMLSFGIPPKLVRLTKMSSQVGVNNQLTDLFETTLGLKQGDGLTPLLFNMALVDVIRQVNARLGIDFRIDLNGTLLQKSKQWRIRYNHELYEVFDELKVSSRQAS